MGEFVCKVADSAGRVFEHVEAAQTAIEARQRLSDRGLFVYSVKPRLGGLGGLMQPSKARAVRGQDFLIFNQQFNTLIKAGLPITKALDLLAERAAAPKLRPVLDDVRAQVKEGALLSEALEAQGIFPRVYVTSVMAGERSGNLPGVLDQYVSYQRMITTFRRKLIASLIYPAILVVVSILILTAVITYIIPEFAKLFEELNVQLPFVTLAVISLAQDFRPLILGLLAAAIVGGLAALAWSRTDAGGMALDRLKLRLPVLGETWLKFQTAQFCRTLSTLLTGGTPLVSALETASGATNSRLFARSIGEVAGRVREGKSLHDSLAATGLVPALALEMIEVGEATGALSPMLANVAEFFEEDVNLRLTALLSILEPVILLSTAGVVLFILVSLYLPIFTFSLAPPVQAVPPGVLR
jgi:type IV pilus assembly protein PilC